MFQRQAVVSNLDWVTLVEVFPDLGHFQVGSYRYRSLIGGLRTL